MIQQAMNGMIAIMLAKFMLNDVPHYLFEDTTMRELKVTRVDERDATPAQLRLIAIKSARLKIPEPVVKGFGEAGRMIRELQAEETSRKKLGGGNPGSPGSIRVQRLTTDMVLDDLERTLSTMNPEMYESMSILKDVMGYYYMEPCIAAWDNGNLIGILVYDTYKDKDAGIQTTHIAQLASFTHTPGVGRVLINEVMKIGEEKRSDIISVGHGPGARGFYENLGFTQNTYEPSTPESMMYKLKR